MIFSGGLCRIYRLFWTNRNLEKIFYARAGWTWWALSCGSEVRPRSSRWSCVSSCWIKNEMRLNNAIRWWIHEIGAQGSGVFGDTFTPHGFTKLSGVFRSGDTQPQSHRPGDFLRGLRYYIWIYKSFTKEKGEGKCAACTKAIGHVNHQNRENYRIRYKDELSCVSCMRIIDLYSGPWTAHFCASLYHLPTLVPFGFGC